MKISKKGLTIFYTGDGKGKTSAAMGLAARAAGANLSVFILQFVKARKRGADEKRQTGEWPLSNEIEFYNAISAPRGMGRIDTDQVGVGFVGILGDRKEKDEHIREALRGLGLAREILVSGKYQVLIVDEIVSAVELDLLTEQDVIDLILAKPPELHLVLTGHKKFKKIIKHCDLVTEMKMIKHPYYDGVLAQKGIDY